MKKCVSEIFRRSVHRWAKHVQKGRDAYYEHLVAGNPSPQKIITL